MVYSIQGIKSDLGFCPIVIGFSSISKGSKFGPATRDRYIIHYVTRGSGYFNRNKVTKGQGFVILPGEVIEYHPSDEDPWTYLWLAAYGADMEQIICKVNADKDTGIFNYSFVDKVEDLFNYLICNNQRIVSPFEITEIFCKIFKHHDAEKYNTELKNNSRIYLDYATEMISREYSQKLTVSNICRKLGVSEQYLHRLFVNEYGKSPKKYISDLRLSQSKILLTETNLSIGEIGNAVGFDDLLAFSKFFSSNTGISPSGYRRGERGGMTEHS